MPSKIETDKGAPAWRRKAIPAAIMAIRIARLPRLAKTPRSRTNGLSAKSWINSAPDAEGDERDPAHARRGPLDPAQEQIDRRGHQGDEEHHPDVHHERGGHLVLEIQVDLIGLALWMEEEQDRPGERHSNDEGGFAAADSWSIRESTLSLCSVSSDDPGRSD
jgi:hypothetical protein